MSTPFGVDLGNSNTVIACARNRGIDIIVNEVSNRSTPSIVGFGPKSRYLGETAKNQQTSNIKNTVENLKRIIGLPHNHPDFKIEEKFFTVPLTKNKSDNGISAKVKYLNKNQEFNATQLLAMYLDKIKDTAFKETKGNITDICLSVPDWYTEKQRRAAADACRIAGLNPVRIVNELTAAAVGYGVFKAADLPENDYKKVAFVDVGHSSYQVSIAAIKRGELKILGTAFDKHFGGRDFDYAIAEHFANEFKSKYKIDVTENPKAFYRVLTAAEKLKKVLSANTQAPFNIESVMNDVDVSSSLSREELEKLVAPLLQRFNIPIETALKEAGLKPEELDSIEVIGGSSRIPAVKTRIAEIFGKPLSFTLNQDEAIAKGNAYICACHSPTVRVRPFKFEDYNLYTVSYFWDKEDEDEDHLEVFPKGGLFPSTKLITLYRKGPKFEVIAKYTKPKELPKGTEHFIAKWTIGNVEPSSGESSIAVKLKLRNDPSGFYTIESAHTVEEQIVKELIEPKEGETQDEDAEPQYKEVKKLVKKNDCSIEVECAALSEPELQKYIEQESQMIMEDKLVADTEERKNQLEEYIYELRGKLEDQYKEFASKQEVEKLTGLLQKAEDWLYEDGYESTKAKYIAKYEELASIGNVIRGRYLAKEQEKKEQYRQKQEAAQAQAMAEKMAQARKDDGNKDDKSKNNSNNKNKKNNKKDDEGDISMD
ncbi:SSE1 [Candida pseudojiufengensis]|uniref:SSE1 n=1 Tax=Candida pseudojiufengensis TaxID=497109 RepID=UPI002224E614|nr:SSE1 [Candida pseudojiufengensis]KAI5966372.1 SSE1 [Candida pseudojiufengensis]